MASDPDQFTRLGMQYPLAVEVGRQIDNTDGTEALAIAEEALETANDASGEASTAAGQAATAVTTANSAQAAVTAQQPWIDSMSPGMVPQITLPMGWSPKEWTSQDIVNPQLGPGLSDHPYQVLPDPDGYLSLVLENSNSRILSKMTYVREKADDVLAIYPVTVVGAGGQGCRVGLISAQERSSTGARKYVVATVAEGFQYLTYFASRSDMGQATVLRPYFQKNSSGGQIYVGTPRFVRCRNGVIPFLAFNPPTDGTTDALAHFTAAIAATGTISNGDKVIDFGGTTYSVSQPPVNNVSNSEWRSLTIKPIGTRAAWSGGSMDSRGLPMQKGVIQMTQNSQKYVNVNIDCSPFTSEAVVGANVVYNRYVTLANGFEDAAVGGGNKSKQHKFINCNVTNFDYYAYRYSSQTGDGFDLMESRAQKRPGQQYGWAVNEADADTGHCVVLDASDGFVQKCTFFNGESCIRQLVGSGTISITDTHPWRSPAVYRRRYFGTIGTVIDTGIRVRHATNQIGTYDTSKYSVARDPTTWKVMVTMLATVAQADALEIPIRRDEVLAFMEGFSSFWSGNYLDGGTIRYVGNGFQFARGYGLVGAMNDVISGFPGQGPISVFEFQPRLNTSEASRTMEWNNTDFGDRCIMYPREDGLAFSVQNLMYDERWLKARTGAADPLPTRFQSQDADGIVEVLHSGITARAGFKLCPFGVTDANGAYFGAGNGSPEGVVTCLRGSYIRLDGGAGTTLYVKESGTGNTGWVAK